MAQAIERHRTAISRRDYSRPVRLALEAGLMGGEGTTFYDYGSGRSIDAALLGALGPLTGAWDPYFAPHGACPGDSRLRGPACHAHVVNLGYVLNVIEDPTERDETLRAAFRLARDLLIVAVRVDRGKTRGEPFGDGVITAAGTFQRIYSPSEFAHYLEGTLAAERVPWFVTYAAPGIAFVVKGRRPATL